MTDSDISGIGGRLRLARTLVGLPARALDRLAGGTEGYASAVEGGSCAPRSDILAGYAAVLGLSLDWLVRGIGQVPSKRRVRTAVLTADPGALDSLRPPKISRKAARARSAARSSAVLRTGAR